MVNHCLFSVRLGRMSRPVCNTVERQKRDNKTEVFSIHLTVIGAIGLFERMYFDVK